jgi:glutamine synthetase
MSSNRLLLEYIWLDVNQGCRSKTKIMNIKKNFEFASLTLSDIPTWNYDGSSTGQATTTASEVVLVPVKFVHDPFRKASDYSAAISCLVLCECYKSNGSTPLESNTRAQAREIFAMESDHKDPMFGLEQEFFISRKNCGKLVPVAFPNNQSVPEAQGAYYCGVGGSNIYGRDYVHEILQKALSAGLHLTGMNAEVAPAQWEFQVCSVGIEAADDLILLRYIANRVLERSHLYMDLAAKPLEGDWNGSGCHINYSTSLMRDEDGFKHIERAIKNLGKVHELHIQHYGNDNHLRLTGKHETSSMFDFSFSVAGRHTSIRIPTATRNDKRGYFEDRRPSSSLDPYVCTALLHATSVGLPVHSICPKTQ